MFEQLKRSSRGGAASKSGGRGGILAFLRIASPRMRIALLCGGLVLIVALMLWLRAFAGKGGDTSRLPAEPARTVSPNAGRPVVYGTPALDPQYRDRIRDATPNDRSWFQGDVVSYLLLEAKNTPAVHEWNRNLIPINAGSAPEIRKDPKPWRYKYVRFRGKLEYIRDEDYEELYGESDPPIGEIYRGRILVAPGRPPARILFFTPNIPLWRDADSSAAHPPYQVITDGWVRGRGIFVKHFTERTPGGEVDTFLVVATRLDRDYKPLPVRSLKDIPFEIIHDDPALPTRPDGRAILAKEYPRPLFRLVRYAQDRAGKPGEALRRKEGLAPAPWPHSPKDYEALVGRPKQSRAKYLGGLGAIAVTPIAYDPLTIPANDAGVEECLNGWLVTDSNKLVQFVAPISLAGEWHKLDRIRFEGFFYKIKLYASKAGVDRVAPVLVLTVLEKVPPPSRDRSAELWIALGFVVGIGLLFVIILREDKTKESYRRVWRGRLGARKR